MKSFNVICGLPRSGSTLLCNILNQNPTIYASSTSPLSDIVKNMHLTFSASPEIKGMLIRNAVETEKRLVDVATNVVETWYASHDKHVFDKGRGWATHPLILRQLFPEANFICTVRDLRAVFASIEKQHRKNPLLDNFENPPSIYERADIMFGPTGVIGTNIVAIEDLLRRKMPNVLFVPYEALVSNPKEVLDAIYSRLSISLFEHNFDNVINTSEDVDALYLNKFPHQGSGPVIKPSVEWPEYLSEDLADTIMNRFSFYNQAFGYTRSSVLQWNN